MQPEILTKLLTPSDDVLSFSAKMLRRMIEYRDNEQGSKESLLIAYRYILETTVHDLGLKFQEANPEMEHGWKA